MTQNDWVEGEKLLREWLTTATLARTAHRIAVKRYAWRHDAVGMVLVASSALLGTSLIAQIEDHPIARVAVLLMSALVFVLSGLQTFWKYHEKAETHQSSRTGFASLCRQIQVVLACPCEARGSVTEVLDAIRVRYDELSAVHAAVPPRMWSEAERETKAK